MSPAESAGLEAAVAAVVAAVDPQRVGASLRALVRVPSVTGDEDGVQDEVARQLEAAGISPERLAPSPEAIRQDPDWPGTEMPRTSLPVVLGRIGRPGGRRLILAAHVDVVPVGDPAAWSVDPWGGEVRDGSLYGRGACDMKGGAAAILEAVRVVGASAGRAALSGEVVAAFVPSEEDGGQGMLAAIRAGLTGDMAVITEPTGLDVIVAHAGAISFRLTVPGVAAHASTRQQGVSAIEKLFVLAHALEADEARRNSEETHPLMTALGLPYATILGTVRGGDWSSTVPDRVVAEGRYGVQLGQTWQDAEAELRSCIAEACAADPFLRDHPATVEVEGGRFSSGWIPADHPLPAGLAAAAAGVLGRMPDRRGVPYGADMRLLLDQGRTPTVMFGPGDIHVAHSADEHVPLAEVVDCARALAAWLVRELSAGE
jgi:acetylornithine deacetylase